MVKTYSRLFLIAIFLSQNKHTTYAARNNEDFFIPKTFSDYGYSRPWDLSPRPNVEVITSKYNDPSNNEYDEPEGIDRPTPSSSKYVYSKAYDHINGRNIEENFCTYQDPKDCIAEAENLYSDFSSIIEQEDSDEGLYDTPYDIKEQVEEMYRSQSVPQRPQLSAAEEEAISHISNESIYQNSLKLLDEIQYVDNEMLRRIQSKPDASSGQIIVEQKSPLPLPRHARLESTKADAAAVETNSRSNSLSGAEITRPLPLKPPNKNKNKSPNQKKKKSPVLPLKPKPSPRPKSTYDKLEFDEGSPNVRDLAQQLKTKIRPTSTVPNITQAKMVASERVNYENNFTKY